MTSVFCTPQRRSLHLKPVTHLCIMAPPPACSPTSLPLTSTKLLCPPSSSWRPQRRNDQQQGGGAPLMTSHLNCRRRSLCSRRARGRSQRRSSQMVGGGGTEELRVCPLEAGLSSSTWRRSSERLLPPGRWSCVEAEPEACWRPCSLETQRRRKGGAGLYLQRTPAGYQPIRGEIQVMMQSQTEWGHSDDDHVMTPFLFPQVGGEESDLDSWTVLQRCSLKPGNNVRDHLTQTSQSETS